MYKLKLKQLYYLLVGRLNGAEVKRSEIERLLPEIDYALTYIEQLEKELVDTKSKYLNQRLELNALRQLRKKNELEINNLKKNIEKVIQFKILYYICINKQTKKQIMKNQNYATITFNGSGTYMVIDSSGQCLFATNTERKSKNFLKRTLKAAGII